MEIQDAAGLDDHFPVDQAGQAQVERRGPSRPRVRADAIGDVAIGDRDGNALEQVVDDVRLPVAEGVEPVGARFAGDLDTDHLLVVARARVPGLEDRGPDDPSRLISPEFAGDRLPLIAQPVPGRPQRGALVAEGEGDDQGLGRGQGEDRPPRGRVLQQSEAAHRGHHSGRTFSRRAGWAGPGASVARGPV